MIKRLLFFDKMDASVRWDFYSYFFLFAILLCQVSNWPASPLFMDCYYHLCVVRGFHDAGGWVGEAFWEYAPFGRPHLYPPLFHLIELFLYNCGVGLITIARFFDFIIYPFFLSTVWFAARTLDSRRLAFFSLFLLCSSFSLFVSVTSNVPFVLAFSFGLLSFLCLRGLKIVSAILLLTFCFYTHSFMPWLFIFAFFLYAFFERKQAKTTFFVCLSAVIFATPFLWHELRYLDFIHRVRAMEFYYAELNPVLYLLSLAGIIFCLRRKQRSLYFFVILIMAMAVLLFTHRDRFFSGIGLAPIFVLAAYSVDVFWLYLKGRKPKIWRIIFLTVFCFLLYGITPIISLSPLEERPVLKIDSSFLDRWGISDVSSVKAETIYYSKFIDELACLIKSSSSAEDIFFFNYSYGGGMLSALSHRATSTSMLAEVGPFCKFNPIVYARFVFLFKDPQDIYYRFLPALINRYALSRVFETDVACLYVHECSAKRKVIPAVIPKNVCFLLLFLVCIIILVDTSTVLEKRRL